MILLLSCIVEKFFRTKNEINTRGLPPRQKKKATGFSTRRDDVFRNDNVRSQMYYFFFVSRSLEGEF